MRQAQIAQLVEQRTENPRVTGSIPVLGTLFLEIKVITILHSSYLFCIHIKIKRPNTRSNILW